MFSQDLAAVGQLSMQDNKAVKCLCNYHYVVECVIFTVILWIGGRIGYKYGSMHLNSSAFDYVYKKYPKCSKNNPSHESKIAI